MCSKSMNINNIITLIEMISKSNIIDNSTINKIRLSHPTLTNNEKKKLIELVSKYLVNGHLFTLNCIRTYAVWEPDEAILEARKKGVFRYKVWQGDNYAKYMIESLISDSQFFHFSNDTLSFLHNKLMLSWL